MSAPTSGSPGLPSILVVDDDADTRAAFEEVLLEAGLRVRTAQDGEEALELARADLPSLAVVDLVMPKVDGWTFISRLRRLPGGANVSVISMTAHGPEILASAPVSQDYLPKPVSLDRLLDAVIRQCKRAGARWTSGVRERGDEPGTVEEVTDAAPSIKASKRS